jgi:hypothetical protein
MVRLIDTYLADVRGVTFQESEAVWKYLPSDQCETLFRATDPDSEYDNARYYVVYQIPGYMDPDKLFPDIDEDYLPPIREYLKDKYKSRYDAYSDYNYDYGESWYSLPDWRDYVPLPRPIQTADRKSPWFLGVINDI